MEIPSSSRGKTIAIIGSGPGGLCSIKSSIENGLIPLAFEMNNEIGGLWHPQTGKMWDTMQTNVSKYVMCFSDFPYKEDINDVSLENAFPSYKVVYNYLQDYANTFQLKKYIKFKCKVIKVEKSISNDNNNNNNKIKITWIDNSNSNNDNQLQQVEESLEFDYLIISSGMFSKPQICDDLILNKLKLFNGKITHSQDFKSNEIYKNKNVVVVGSSISGCEIASEISKVTNKCIQVGHDNLWIYNKFLPNKNNTKLVPCDSIMFNRNENYLIYNLKPYNKFLNAKKEFREKYCHKQVSTNSKIKVPLKCLKRDFIVSSNYLEQVENNSITTYTGNNFNIIESSRNSITFKNDKNEIYTEDDIDEVIICNGYLADLSFLDKSIQDEINYNPNDTYNPVCLYKNIFAPNCKNIAFVSFFRGLFTVELELLCRWACLVFSGKLNFPNNDQLINNIKKRNNNNKKCNHHNNNSSISAGIGGGINNNQDDDDDDDDYCKLNNHQFLFSGSTIYLDSIAKEMECLPNFEEMKLNDPELYDICFNNYFTPAVYRLVGHDSKPDLAREIIYNVNKVYNKFHN